MTVASYNYGGSTVTVHGEAGDDVIMGGYVGGGGTQISYGEDDDDDLGGGTGSPDQLYGGANAVDDVINDLGGASETLDGGSGSDCIEDSNCTFAGGCTCGTGTDGSPCAGCTSCENAPAHCSLSCPGW